MKMYDKYIKRFIDVILSLMCIPFVVFIVLCLAPAIYFTDKGPIFYNSERIGKNGKIFKMYKLRSMVVNAPDIRLADGSTFNSANDPRVTSLGRFMRKTSVDELPQVFNILIGDMSFVGPRPNLITKPFEELDEAHKYRLKVRPGITGYNQAYFRNSIPAAKRCENDVYYVDHLSFVFDIRIVYKTIISVVKKENIYIENNIEKIHEKYL